MHSTEVLHAVLQVSHIPKEVSGELFYRLDGRSGSERRAGRAVLEAGRDGCGCCRVAGYERRNEEGEKDAQKWDDKYEVGVEADEGIDSEERERMRPLSP